MITTRIIKFLVLTFSLLVQSEEIAMFNNAEKQRAFENAISCLYNGYWKEDWNSCELSEWESEEVWNAALYQFEKLVRRCV